MSEFTTPLVVELIGNDEWSVYEKFEYHVGTYPSKEIIGVPKGFHTDFASVPRIFWNIISPIDKHGKAAVLHDYLYSIQYKNNRKLCDNIFKEAMGILGVKKWKIFVMYWAVRLFGKSHFKK